MRDLIFTTAFVFVTAFSAQIVLLVGTRNFGRLLVGRYRRPRELHATFMFADVRGSTSIAERLGHARYSSFLRDFFADVTNAIHAARGEVYQYIGDEVVVVWPGRHDTNRWLACFNDMRAAVEAERVAYQARYGVVPEFKAGVHAGDVVMTEVGTLQRAHVYHGDVLNTAARIQAECEATGFDLLVSEAAMHSIGPELQSKFASVGSVSLRGKAELVGVFGFADARVDAGQVRHATAARLEGLHDAEQRG